MCACVGVRYAHGHMHTRIKRAAVWEDHFRPVSWACCRPGPSCGAGISVQTPPGRSGRPGQRAPRRPVQLGRPGSPGLLVHAPGGSVAGRVL